MTTSQPASSGHWLDTGDGPKPLTAITGGSALLESAQMLAYQAYLNHAKDCDLCPAHASQCDRAAALWQAYRQARG